MSHDRSQGEALDWSGEAPRSLRFEDVYYSGEDGLAESRAVFLQGCGLPQAWAGRDRFVVGELGFGTGLNIAALIEAWRRTRPAGARLHVFSVEAFPLSAAQAERALSRWPELQTTAQLLLGAWPDDRRGFHRVEIPELSVFVDVAVLEAAEALEDWSGRADAWFLDGFAPAKNPDMWREEVIDLVARRSADGARLATFTVAGMVRRRLQAAGFRVDRRPGFGRKRERLEAVLDGPARTSAPALRPRVGIVGAGIAGASLARALRTLDVTPLVLEAEAAGAGASGNPSALITPRLDAGFGPSALLHAQAFERAVQLYRSEAADAIIAQGALQIETASRDVARFDRIAAWPGFATGALARLEASETAARLNETSAPGALAYRDALVVDPAAVLRAWLRDIPVERRSVAAVQPDGDTWRLVDEAGRLLADADVVCLAAGAACASFAPGLRLEAVRGQVSWCEAVRFHGEAAAWGGYAIPTKSGGVLFGASHVRGDPGVDLRDEESAANLERLAQGRPALAARVRAEGGPLPARASTRAATPDRTPVAGAVPGEPGLFVLSGLGGRGFTLAPLLAEHIAALALAAPSPLPRALAAVTEPSRLKPRG